MLERNYYDENLMGISYNISNGGDKHRDVRYCNVIGHNSMSNILKIFCNMCVRCVNNNEHKTQMTTVYHKYYIIFYRLVEDLFKSETFYSLYILLFIMQFTIYILIFIKSQPTIRSQLVDD
jgi:hypothetical protein